MLIFSLLIGAIFAGTPNNRPFSKKLKHLKNIQEGIMRDYFVRAVPNSKNDAHQNGTIKKEEARIRIADRLKAKMQTLSDVFDDANSNGCIKVVARGSIERYVENDYKVAVNQMSKLSLRLRSSIDADHSKTCKRAVNRATRKIRRFHGILRTKYCDKVYQEDWCLKPYEYTLDERVQN